MSYTRSIACLALAGALAGCSGNTVKDTLGLNSRAPDEFRVVARPPLSVPPEFNLRPPVPGAQPTAMLPADQQAQSLMHGTKPAVTTDQGNTFALQPAGSTTSVAPAIAVSPSTAAGSSAETQFLRNAGADKADPHVKSELAEHKMITQDQQEEEDSWWDIFSTSSGKKEPVVDAKKEKERIKTDEAEGKPVTEGDTPEVKQKDTGVLGTIFGY